MMVQMLGVFAEFERATIIDRVIAGMERKAARGEWCGGQRPFGYLIDKESSTLTVKEDEAALVPHIFRLYVSDRLGANAIAGYLNNEGHRTRNGRPWSHMSVLTVLRNRAYVGEVFFRGAHHASSHQPLIDPETFTAAQDLLVERGGEKAACRSNSYDYLLSRLLICTMCGKRYVGAAAHGRNGRYEYYVCFSRQRYGSAGCSADRLPARELEEAIIDLIGATYSDVSLVDRAFEAAVDRTHKVNGKLQEESHRIDAELKKTEAAIDRYLAAFEDGSMSSAQCGPRLEQLSGRLAQLQARREELVDLHGQQPDCPDYEQIAALRGQLDLALRRGEVPTIKAALRELVASIDVDNGRRVRPRFRVPGAVRTHSRLAAPTGFEPVSPP